MRKSDFFDFRAVNARIPCKLLLGWDLFCGIPKMATQWVNVVCFRYKSVFFSNTNTAANAKEMLLIELQRLTAEEDQQEDHSQYEPPTRKPCRDQASSSLDSIFAEIANEQASAALTPAAVGVTAQLETYLREALMAREDTPLQYWEVNKLRFPSLAKMACRYLSAPCSSVENGCLAQCHIL